MTLRAADLREIRGDLLATPARPVRLASCEHQLQVALGRLPGLAVEREVPADVSVHDGGDPAGQVVAASGRQGVPPVQEVAYQRLVLTSEPVQVRTAVGERCRLWQVGGALHVA